MPDAILVEDDNLSRAWAKVLVALHSRPADSLAPVLVSIAGYNNGEPAEDPSLCDVLDTFLHGNETPRVRESASTIFPYRSWVLQGRPPRKQFFDWYIHDRLPRLRARSKKNCYGTYFERMIGFSKDHTPNQLDDLIEQWKKRTAGGSRPRRSALQAVIVDPLRDLTGQALRGFPCLQQVSFTYDDNGGLAVTAYYPSQYIDSRAYGNYLGLSHLGAFMAHEFGLTMTRLNCFVAHASVERSWRSLDAVLKQAQILVSGTT